MVDPTPVQTLSPRAPLRAWLGPIPGFLSLIGLSAIGCATPEPRPTPVAVEQTAPTVEATPTTLSDTLAAAPQPRQEQAAPPEPEERKRIIEEYKTLALKNDCSRGYPKLSGTWKFVGESRTPNYADTLVINGTRFKESLSGNPDGKFLAAEIEGEMRCVFKNRLLVQLDKVRPEGAYGNKSGDVYPCDILGDMDPTVERILMICYFDWDLRTAAGLEFEFERVEEKH